MKKILWLPVLFICLNSMAQTKQVQLLNPAAVAAPKGYSQAAVIDLGAGKMVIISGQIPLNKQGQLVGAGDMGKQTEQVFQNIKGIVEELGGNMSNVVKLGYFITDISGLQNMRTARDKYINTAQPPASTLVQVNKLFRDDVMIEVEATAIIPK